MVSCHKGLHVAHFNLRDLKELASIIILRVSSIPTCRVYRLNDTLVHKSYLYVLSVQFLQHAPAISGGAAMDSVSTPTYVVMGTRSVLMAVMSSTAVSADLFAVYLSFRIFQLSVKTTVLAHPTNLNITACSSSQWTCSNGQCIYSYLRCDGGAADCADGSDELNCSEYLLVCI